MVKVKDEIQKNGFYRLTAMSTDAQRHACISMEKQGLIKSKIDKYSNYVDFIKNWI